MISVRKQDVVKLEDVLHLYQAVGWTNYTNQPQMLEQALPHSLAVYLAFDGGENSWLDSFGWRWFFISFCTGFDCFA